MRLDVQSGIGAQIPIPRVTSESFPAPADSGHWPIQYFSDISGSRHGGMRELRVQSGGRPPRLFYAFDPRRTSILLIGGDKTGNDRFYEQSLPVADALHDEQLEELRKEGLIE